VGDVWKRDEVQAVNRYKGDPFKDKSAIVTGAGSGIGKALSTELARRGAVVYMTDVNRDTVTAAAYEITRSGGKTTSAVVDVTDADAVKGIVDKAYAEHARIDYIFNNAGIAVMAELRDMTLEDWSRLIDINVRGVVHGVHAAYPIMIEQGHGHIVNIASAAGLAPVPMLGAYCATKHAVVGLTQTLRAEAKAFGVRASVVCPAVIGTPIMTDSKYVNTDRDQLLKLSVRPPFPVDEAAKRILAGAARNRDVINVTPDSVVGWRIRRFFPWLIDLGNAQVLDRARRFRKEG